MTVAHFDTLQNLPNYTALVGLGTGACVGAYRLICSLARLRARSRPAHAALQLGNMFLSDVHPT